MDELTPLPFPNGRTVATAVFAQTPCYNAPGRKRLSFVWTELTGLTQALRVLTLLNSWGTSLSAQQNLGRFSLYPLAIK